MSNEITPILRSLSTMLARICDTSASVKSISKALMSLSIFAGFILFQTTLAVSQNASDKIEGPNACAECHKHEALAWKKTHHYSTFRKMPRNPKAREIAKKMGIRRIKKNALCTNCHFTIKNVKGRDRPVAGISCESCHSAGKEFIKIHSEFSGKTKETETKNESADRWGKAEKAGMIRPGAIYKLAKNCLSCHVVPQEDLVNIGGHPAGSPFELLSWSQGEVRHNLHYSKGKKNTEANPARKRILYIVGLVVEFEASFRAVGVAKEKKAFAILMARRADRARKKIFAAAKALPQVKELQEIARYSKTAGLKLNNNTALARAADQISEQLLKLLAAYDGTTFSKLDGLLPSADQYKGKSH